MRRAAGAPGGRRLALAFLGLGATGAVLVALAAAAAEGIAAILLPAAILLATVFAAWRLLQVLVLRRVAALAAAARVIAHGGEEARLPMERFAALTPLPAALNELAEKLFGERKRVDEAVAQSTLRVEEQNSRLAAILKDLHDGVLVCNLEHQILLYNRRALSLLGVRGALGLGRSLLPLLARDPLLHALERLTRSFGQDAERAEERHAEVLTAAADGRSLLQGRMGLVVMGGQVTGYVLTLSDATAELATLGKCDALLREATEALRQPIANIRAAAETLADNPDLPAGERVAFERMLSDQAEALSARLEDIAGEYRGIAGRLWPTGQILSTDLIGLVAWRAEQEGLTVGMAGPTHWLRRRQPQLGVAVRPPDRARPPSWRRDGVRVDDGCRRFQPLSRSLLAWRTDPDGRTLRLGGRPAGGDPGRADAHRRAATPPEQPVERGGGRGARAAAHAPRANPSAGDGCGLGGVEAGVL